ncbi:MAG: hypothetical protein WDM77_02200 [Steroidobacteraceae bacterium]
MLPQPTPDTGRGALEVFNQAIGVKEIADIDSFVRKHMLEPSEAFDSSTLT